MARLDYLARALLDASVRVRNQLAGFLLLGVPPHIPPPDFSSDIRQATALIYAREFKLAWHALTIIRTGDGAVVTFDGCPTPPYTCETEPQAIVVNALLAVAQLRPAQEAQLAALLGVERPAAT